tara:strand:+ start:342 stop:1124 length:783 start_codon:yes stop_codon:yes gene_type:complete
MKLKDLVLGLIVLLIIYLVYIWFFTDSTKAYLISSVVDASVPEKISSSELPKRLTNDFTYSFWIYINSWETDSGKNKVIIQRGDGVAPNKGIKIYLTKYVNNLKIDIPMIPTTSSSSTSSSSSDYQSTDSNNCEIKNIPLQRWVCITISVNNRSSDLYLDGKLVNTCVYSGVISDCGEDANLPINICSKSTNTPPSEERNGYNGSISNVLYYARAVNPREAYSIYRQGPGGGNTLLNILNKYGLKFSFMSHGKEIHHVQI